MKNPTIVSDKILSVTGDYILRIIILFKKIIIAINSNRPKIIINIVIALISLFIIL